MFPHMKNDEAMSGHDSGCEPSETTSLHGKHVPFLDQCVEVDERLALKRENVALDSRNLLRHESDLMEAHSSAPSSPLKSRHMEPVSFDPPPPKPFKRVSSTWGEWLWPKWLAGVKSGEIRLGEGGDVSIEGIVDEEAADGVDRMPINFARTGSWPECRGKKVRDLSRLWRYEGGRRPGTGEGGVE